MIALFRYAVMAVLIGMAVVWGVYEAQAQLYGRASQQGGYGHAAQNAPQNVLIILDASDSMNDRLGGQSKIQAAKAVVLDTVRSLPPHVNVGLRVYGHKTGRGGFVFQGPFGGYAVGGDMCRQTDLLVPLGGNNRAQIASQLLGIQAVGKTPITYTLQQAVSQDFLGRPGKKTIILVSDGRETCAANPCDLVLDMVRHGVDIRVNTIGLATHDRVADDQLKCVALATKGRFYSAETAADLARSLQDSMSVQTQVQAKIYTGPE